MDVFLAICGCDPVPCYIWHSTDKSLLWRNILQKLKEKKHLVLHKKFYDLIGVLIKFINRNSSCGNVIRKQVSLQTKNKVPMYINSNLVLLPAEVVDKTWIQLTMNTYQSVIWLSILKGYRSQWYIRETFFFFFCSDKTQTRHGQDKYEWLHRIWLRAGNSPRQIMIASAFIRIVYPAEGYRQKGRNA